MSHTKCNFRAVNYLCKFVVIDSTTLALVWNFKSLSDEVILCKRLADIFDTKSSPILYFSSFFRPVFVTFNFSTLHKSEVEVLDDDFW